MIPLIQLSAVRRTYLMGESEVHALRGVDLTINAGEFVAIVGPSGSGKSSLMYLLGLLDRPSEGSYRLDGVEVSTLDDAALSRLRGQTIGYVFQQFNLLAGLDIADNIGLPLVYSGVSRQDRRTRGEELAGVVGLGNRLGHTPRELSGGQMQRVAIARGLSAHPRLVLADEPTGALDTKTGAEIIALLRSLHRRGNTVIIVTHDPGIAAKADRVVRIVDGEIVSDGPSPEAESQKSEGAQRIEGISDIPAFQHSSIPHSPGPLRPAGPTPLDLLAMAWRDGLAAHRLRTALTMLGIVFGVAAVIAMTAITEGGKQSQLESIKRIGRNAVQVLALDLSGARLARERRLNPDGLTLEDRDLLTANIPGVETSASWKVLPAEVRRDDAVATPVRVLGVAGDLGRVAGLAIAEGRFLDDADDQRLRRVCLLGAEAARQLSLKSPVLGAQLMIGDQPFTVVGVLRPLGAPPKAEAGAATSAAAIADRDRDVIMPYGTLRAYFRKLERESRLDGISLRLAEESTLVERGELARRIVAARHDDAEDFRVVVPLEQLRQAQQTKEVFNVLITVIAAISLIVGGIGIMNIMLASVTERTKEIGVRRAVGASRWDVLRQFLAEAGLIAACGGVVGLAAGVGAGLAIQAVFGFPVAFSWAIMALAVGVSAAVGIAFGIYPAWRAAAMDPVEALRA